MTVSVPSTATYGEFNITVTNKAGSPAPIAPTMFTLIVGAKVAVNPTAIADTSITSGTIPFTLNITNSPPTGFTAFTVSIFFNETLLHFQGVDYSGGVLGSDISVSTECLNGASVPGSGNTCNLDLAVDAPGVFTLSILRNDALNTQTPTGTLFTVTFIVVAKGFAPIHIVAQQINTAPDGTPLRTVGYDGYFTNKKCGVDICKPPVVSVIPPLRPLTSRRENFNSNAVSQNPGGFITVYNWTMAQGLDKQRFNFVFNFTAGLVKGKPPSNVTTTFDTFGTWLVTLGVQDNYTARAYYSISIVVLRIWVDLGIASVLIDNTVRVLPGTVVHIIATATNNGVNPENSTLRLSINYQSKAAQPVVNLAPGLTSSLSYDWHTSGLTPRVYRIDTVLDEVRNATTGQILENDTATLQGKFVDSNNVRVSYVQLIEPLPNGIGIFLGLTLPETIGVGIVVAAVAVFVGGLVRKSRLRSPEDL